ncbi:stage II sporulation protein M [Accumulibacter sp.]|uniref:stage II sporulation protein M n=1 Tax=Accumulibacter sp. TaxID=2053492 RepID=UPI0025D976CA|nr:stage II sporulation protein M [Accumulibacter sp.]MCM8625179.1 stage II sporulation protein M [Accumulibacter sp.]
MKERRYIFCRQAEWEAWDQWLTAGQRFGSVSPEGDPAGAASFPHRFRRLCHDLALARDRNYSAVLVDDLHRRVLAVHQRVHGSVRPDGSRWLRFLSEGFPELARSEWRVMLVAFLLLFVPLLTFIVVAQAWPECVQLVLSPGMIGEVEEMYSPTARHLGRPRAASSDWAMWGFYVAHNLRIDFQAFAGGLTFGLGSVFYLLYNGLHIGAIAGHLTQIGYGSTFWGFVAGHSAFEMSGAVLSGAAGLKLGMALIAPGQRTRLAALRQNASIAVRLLYGAAILTFLAAFIEAFWSPLQAIPFEFRVAVGLLLWLLTCLYFLLAGRSPRAP